MHSRQFVQVPQLSRSRTALWCSTALSNLYAHLLFLVIVDAVADLPAAGVQRLGRDEFQREVLLPPRALATACGRRPEVVSGLLLHLLVCTNRDASEGRHTSAMKIP